MAHGTKNPSAPSTAAGCTEAKGKALLQAMAASLRERGIPSGRYIKVNIETGEFVTGKSPEETELRFQTMHHGATGWMQLLVTQAPSAGDRNVAHVARGRRRGVARSRREVE